MVTYRRNFVPGGTYFFTVNLADRRAGLLTENPGLLRTAFRHVRERHPFAIDAIVVLPDHLHTIWTLPAGDADFAPAGGGSKPRSQGNVRLASAFRQAEQ